MLDLIGVTFQSGEVNEIDSSFLEDLAVSVIGSLLGFAGAYILFWLQIRKEKNKEQENRKEIIDRKLDYFDSQLRKLVKSADVQLENLGKFLDSFQEGDFLLPLLSILPERQFEHFATNFNNEEYYFVYLARLSADDPENFNRINGLSYFFLEEHQEIRAELEHTGTRLNQLLLKYQKLVEEARNDAALIVGASRRENRYSDLEKMMNHFIAIFYTEVEDKSNITEAHEKFSRPFKEALFHNFKNSEVAMGVVNKLALAGRVYGEVQFLLKEAKSSVEKIRDRYKKHLGELEQLSNIVAKEASKRAKRGKY